MKKTVFAVIALFLALSCNKDENQITASGTIEAEHITISAKSGGEVIALYAEEGATVKQGAPLAQINHRILNQQLASAQAGLDMAKTQLVLLLKGARTEDLGQAEEHLIQARQNKTQAQEDYNRIADLFKTGSATQKQQEDAKTRLTLAEAQFKSVSYALQKLKNPARPEDVELAKDRIKQAEAAVNILTQQVADTSIKAAIDGTITNRFVNRGEMVAGGTALFSMADLKKLYVMIYVTEVELGHLFVGQKAYVSIDSFPERLFEGTISYISQEAEFTPKNIQTKQDRVKLVFGVKITLPNPNGYLKPGLPADAVIQLHENNR